MSIKIYLVGRMTITWTNSTS